MKTTIFRSIKSLFDLSEDKGDELEVIDAIKRGVEFKGTNLWTLIFAIIIASVGLNVNSTAVIIGAMLISPLMGPIMGIGLGAGILDTSLIKHAFKNLAIATVIALITSSIYFLISPISTAQSELLARTTPTIWDVLIAFFGGLAGIVAFSRKKFSNVIPGVAIATALMPPLCTAGFGIGTGQWGYFIGAFYLFIINSVFISIATFLMVRFLKFHSISYEDQNLKRRVQKWVGYIALLTILPSIFMAYKFVSAELFKQNVNRLINQEIPITRFTILNKTIEAQKHNLNITILDYKKVDSIKNLIESKKDVYDLEELNINVTSSNFARQNELSASELKDKIVQDVFNQQIASITKVNEELKILEKKNKQDDAFNNKKREAVREFQALFGAQKEIGINQIILFDSKNIPDTIVMVYVKPKSSIKNKVNQIETWLNAKFENRKVKFVID